MDNQTQSFLELCAMNDLVQLAADKRAAWLWSSDGARILWSNAAGAAFFSAQSVADVHALTALERSPARPHIARIATSGLTDRFSIDRLRFYRGLRVMLLTCQCKRVDLGNGETAALIVCSDKGLALTREPIPAFAHLLRSAGSTVFLVSNGKTEETHGALQGTPKILSLPEGQKVLIGHLELDGRSHDGGMLQIPAGPQIYVLNDAPREEPVEDETEPPVDDGLSLGDPAAAATALAPTLASSASGDVPGFEQEDAATGSQTQPADPEETDSAEETDGSATAHEEAVPQEEDLPVTENAAEAPSADAGTDEDAMSGDARLDMAEAETAPEYEADEDPDHEAADIAREQTEAETAPEPGAIADAVAEEDQPDTDGADAQESVTAEDTTSAEPGQTGDGSEDTFVFQPRRRPVRFAWKMDVDQRFTFLSDEFAEVLGPDATDIVGSTWEDVSSAFGLDPRGNISRALDRRDTWSGKTVAWPVTGAALRVPVDLAALPAFDRNRKFEGYRGFGVCRTSDAVQDPSGFIPLPVQALESAAQDEDPGPHEGAEAEASELLDAAEDAAEPPAEANGSDPDPEAVPETGDQAGAGEGWEDSQHETSETEAGSSDAEDLEAEDRQEAGSDPEDANASERSPSVGMEDPTADIDSDAAESADTSAPEDPRVAEETGDADAASSSQDDPAHPAVDAPQEPSEAADEPVENAEDGQEEEQLSAEDLKPAKPDSLAGKTFFGASAAALVGSLARFKGKKAPEPAAASNDQDDIPAEEPAEEVSLSEDLKNAAAALDAGLEDNAPPGDSGEPSGDDTLEEAADLEESAEAEEVAGIEDASDLTPTDEDLASHEDETDADPAETEANLQEAAFRHENGNYIAEVSVSEQSEDQPQEPSDEHAPDPDPEETQAEEPVGIAGPAPLKPAEIESAVKTLAKSYKQPERRSPDLFDETAGTVAEEETVADIPEDAAESGFENEDASAIGGDTALQSDDVQDATAALESVDEAVEDAVKDASAALKDEDTDKDQPSADLLPDTEEDPALDEEREFFEETAAYEHEERAAEAQGSAPDEAEPGRKTGEVIPLATARPRVVPVDTSGLSRPERQAFRKIAEALGARLEGDLEDFEAPDPEEEDIPDDLPPEVPEAGPIDPSLLDRLPIGIAIVYDREVLYANKALLSMLGYTSIAALSEAGGLEALFIDDTDELADAVGVDGEVDEAMKVRLADGGVLTVDAHMHSVPWNGTRGLMISIAKREIKQTPAAAAPSSPNFFAEVRSELDNAQDQIAEMDTILETATDGVLVLDQYGTILKVNGSAEALFSANRADMIGAPFTQYLAPESNRAAMDYLDGLSRNGVASILNDGREVLGQVPAGGLIPLFMTMGRITSRDDDAKYCAVLRDITQWKTAEEELTQAKRQAENASSQKSDFLAKISHEIRTPLNAIIGFSEVMMEERFGSIGNDRYKDYLKDIRTSGSHIMSLVNDLLDLSKIEAGKLDLKFTAVSTNDVINECVALMQPQANRERVIIRASLPDSVPDVVADQRSLRQIVLNLLSNGIKYNKSGGQVILSTALESNGEVALRVRDTGTGMTSKQLSAALEPFRQLHTSSRGGGTGLGLPLTKALVEANRASFHIDSTPDQGTLVEIIFPTQRVLSE
ncbi:MAG: histidine kinase dimerization/phospho-acceptor domain-containing protein [Roseibium sp.]|uniref:ATP-binding protein n=1 Tax=Roseibium sp. TaxID=1936156 RepID=UPI003D9C5634